MSCGHNCRRRSPRSLAKKKSYKHVSDFDLLCTYDHLERGIEGKDFLKYTE